MTPNNAILRQDITDLHEKMAILTEHLRQLTARIHDLELAVLLLKQQQREDQ